MTHFRSAARALLAAAAVLATVPAFAEGTPGDPAVTAAHAGNYVVEPYHTRVQFAVSHMGFTEWYGDFTGVAGSLTLDLARAEADKVDITIPVASISTTNIHNPTIIKYS